MVMDKREILAVIEKAKDDNAKELDLSGRKLTRIPSEALQLTGLQSLFLDENLITIIPPEIKRLKCLRKLSLHENLITWIPPEIGQLENLEELSLARNKITTIPPEFSRLDNLLDLYLYENQITSIPKGLIELRSIKKISLSDNQISQIPQKINQLKSLERLYLSNNRITEIPLELLQLQQLKKLFLDENQISLIPPQVSQLQSLQVFSLGKNRLAECPPEISQLQRLEALYLENNQLTQFPPDISKLTSLQELRLDYNQLKRVSYETTQINSLEFLSLAGNQIKEIPPEVSKLKNLKTLYLHDNSLTKIPPEIAQLSNLEKIWLDDNELTQVPPEIVQLPIIQEISLNNNLLTHIPLRIAHLHNLQRLSLSENLLPADLMAAHNQGIRALRSFLQGISKDGEKLYEAKVLLIGEGNVGKTSLREALRGNDFVTCRPTTHGIEVKPLSLPNPNSEKSEIQLNLWDFGGQPVYRITHQFFYSERSLYVLVWWPREGAEQGNIEGWIKRIVLRVGSEAKVLIVSTHCDVGQRFARVNKTRLIEKYPKNIIGFYEVDSESGTGIEELKTDITLAASQLPHMGDPQSKSWNNAKNEVVNLECSHISINQFNEICAKHKLDKIASETLANLMNDLGHLIYFSKDEGLKDLLVLKPEWLTKAIGFVLEDRMTNEASGILCHDDLDRIWRNHGIEGREQYSKDFHPYFLRLMEKFDVCYRLEDVKNKSLVTQLVPAEQPKEIWTHSDPVPEDLAQLRLIFDLDQSPPGLIPWLIVRTQRYTRGLHWQGGMLLRYKQHGEALIRLSQRQLSITTRSAFPGHLTSILREVVETLIHDRWEYLKFKVTVPCYLEDDGKPCEGNFPLKALYKARKKERATVDCRECYEDLDVSRLLSGFDTPDLDLAQKLREAEEQRDNIAKAASQERAELKRNQDMLYSQAAQYFRGLINAISLEAESRCPSLYTLLPEKLTGIKNKGWVGHRVTFWCDFPGEEHPRCKIGSGGPGEYIFEAPGKWLTKNAGKLKTLSTCLRLIIPMIAPAVEGFYEGKLEDELKASLNYMDKAASTLAGEYLPKEIDTSLDFSEEQYVRRGRAHESLLSVLSDMLFKQDKHKAKLGLRRMLDETGHYLWLCPKHAKVYDPGLPILK